MATTHQRVTRVFRDIFDDDELVISEATSAKDVRNWDSLAQIKLVIALEEEFEIKFTTHEVAQMKCVGDLLQAMQLKGIND